MFGLPALYRRPAPTGGEEAIVYSFRGCAEAMTSSRNKCCQVLLSVAQSVLHQPLNPDSRGAQPALEEHLGTTILSSVLSSSPAKRASGPIPAVGRRTEASRWAGGGGISSAGGRSTRIGRGSRGSCGSTAGEQNQIIREALLSWSPCEIVARDVELVATWRTGHQGQGGVLRGRLHSPRSSRKTEEACSMSWTDDVKRQTPHKLPITCLAADKVGIGCSVAYSE